MAEKSKPQQTYEAFKSGVSWLAAEVTWWLMLMVGLGFVVLLAATVAAKAGHPIRMLPTAAEQWLVYIAGALWLYRGGKL